MNIDICLRSRKSWTTVLLCVATFMASALPAGLRAQESQKEWRISDPEGQSAIYNTQAEAADAIEQLPAPAGLPPEFQFGWQYVKQIKSTTVSESGTSVVYWMGKEQPNDPEWSYHANATYSSEEAMRSGLLAYWQQQSSPACPPATLEPQGEWAPPTPDHQGKYELKTFTITIQHGDNTTDNPCTPYDASHPTGRSRRLQCPVPFTEWKDEHAACVNEEFVATITSKTDECDSNGGSGTCPVEGGEENQTACDGEVGNPCNVKTGEKSESELDFDLGWVSLSRHYHSGVSTSSGGFGHGWSHSLGARLVFGGPDTVGIIEGTGYQRPFRKLGSVFEATDGSGDRLVSSGGWKLYASNRILTFDGDGRADVQFNPDGTSLTYAYDSRARLSTVTHNTGRSIAFQYQSNAYSALIESVTLAGTPLVTYTYSPNGQVKTATYPQSGTRTYHYDDSRFRYHLTGITAEDNQRYSTFAYDAKGRVTSSTHDGGADAVSLVYLSQGGAVVTDALGHETTYALTPGGPTDPSRKVTGLTDSRGSITRTYYPQSVDFRRRLDILTDRNGTQTKHLYAEMADPVTGQPSSVHTVKEAFGLPEERVSEQRWDLASNRLLASRVADREVRYGYNARLQPAQVAVKDLLTGDVRNTTMLYCEASDVAVAGSTCPIEGLVKSIDGPRTDVSDVTAYTYYPADHASCATTPSACAYRRGDLWKVTNPAGQVSEILAYDAAGRAASLKDANGVVTELEYHPRGWPTVRRVHGTTAAADVVESVEYWPTGLVRKITDPDGVAVSFGYDAAQRLRTVADDAGNTITYDLDDAGNRLQEDVKDSTGVLKKTLSRIFNTLGQMTTLKDAGSHPTAFTYDVDGNPELQTDALQRVADRDHDPLNRLKRMVQDVGGIAADTGVAYDDLDNITKVTDPKGLDTDYNYNGFGDLLELQSPDTGTTTSTYDSAGNVKTRTDARGVTRTHSYDALNRPTGTAYAETNFNVAYVYDLPSSACQAGETFGVGRIAQMTDRSGSTHFCYDRIGRLVRKVQVTNGISLTVRYAYTKAGRLDAVTYPDGTLVDYVRNTLGQVTQVGVTPAEGGGRQLLIQGATYAPFGPAIAWTYGNGRLLQRPLDLDYRPSAVHDAAAGGLDLGYGYDEVGQLTDLGAAGSTIPAVKLVYDDLGRLTEFRDAPADSLIEGYSYDDTGNRLSATIRQEVALPCPSCGPGDPFPTEMQLVTTDYTYPGNSHRLAAVGDEARNYDAAGNLESIGSPTQPGGISRTFMHGADGRLALVQGAGAVPLASYRHNARGERVRRTAASADIYTVYDESGHWLGNYDAVGEAKQQAIWLDDMPVGVTAGAVQQLHYIQPDHLGTPRAVIDPIRNVAVWSWGLKGEAFGDSPPNEDADNDGVLLQFDMRFPGQRLDSATGLSYNYFRDYEPATGRYVQSDPLGLKGGVSSYSYAVGRPISFVDPLGLEAESNWFRQNDGKTLWQGANSYNSPAGIYTVAAHIYIDPFTKMPQLYIQGPDGDRMSPEDVWNAIKADFNSGDYKVIRLAVCEAGANSTGGRIFADELNKISRVPVQATPNLVGFPANGRIFIGSPAWPGSFTRAIPIPNAQWGTFDRWTR